MSPCLALATLLSLAATPRPIDDDPEYQPAFVEIARRLAPEIERVNDLSMKTFSTLQLAQYRIRARDIAGAKRAYAQAADLALAPTPDGAEPRNYYVVGMIARGQYELGERAASAATLARGRTMALEMKSDFLKAHFLESILDAQREQDDRDAIAATVKALTAVIKARRDSSLDPNAGLLMEVQAKAGDVRGALNALLEAPPPTDEIFRKSEEESRDEFRANVLAKLLFACKAGDEEIVARIAKLIRGMKTPSSKNRALERLAWTQARLKQFDEAARTVDSIDLKAESDFQDPRRLAIEAWLDLADYQLREHDEAGAQRSAQKAAETLASFEKVKDRSDAQYLRMMAQAPFGTPESRLITIHARTGERGRALALAETLPSLDRIKALEEIADLDDYAGHRDDAASARKQAVKLARDALIEIDNPAPPAETPKPRPAEPPPPPEEPELIPPLAPGDLEIPLPRRPRKKTDAEIAAEEAAARKARRDETMLAMIRLNVRTGDLSRAEQFLKDAGEPRQAPTKAMVRALGQSGDLATALARIDAISDPAFKIALLTDLASGLQERHDGKSDARER